MAHTYISNPFNSTPFSSCCNVASFGSKCDRCGEKITHHEPCPSVVAARRRTKPGHCLMCGARRGDPAVSGNCHC